jgi:molecular chaperone DnaJ
MRVAELVTCEACRGCAAIGTEDCPRCSGSGKDPSFKDFAPSMAMLCAHCHGGGKGPVPCPSCGGRGKIRRMVDVDP